MNTDVLDVSVIDVVDTRTSTLAWRGWAEAPFDGVIDNRAWMEETIDKPVTRMLARLPAAAHRIRGTIHVLREFHPTPFERP